MARNPLAGLLACLCLGSAVPGQQPGEEPLQPKDPYTEGDPAAMAAAGVVAYGPFPWADFQSSSEVDKVLGKGRVLWLETAHFRIGCNLNTVPLPVAAEARRFLLEELKALRTRLPKVKEKPKQLDTWLRLHLYAARAEALYADFLQLLGKKDEDFGSGAQPRGGKYLGLPDKFLLLLFQKEADLARYLERFCGVRGQKSYRHYHQKSFQMLAAVAMEGFENADEMALHTHVAYSLVHNFVSGLNGFFYDLPPWLGEGLAHAAARKVPTDFVNVAVADGEAVDQERQHLWPQRVRARVGFEHFPRAEELLGWRKQEDLGFVGHLMAWSRVEFLRQRDAAALGKLLLQLKSMALPGQGGMLPIEQVQRRQLELLQELFGLDPARFDAEWKAWVLKTYPKK